MQFLCCHISHASSHSFCISDEMRQHPDLLEFSSLKCSFCSTCQSIEWNPLKAMSHPIDVWCPNVALIVGGMLPGATCPWSPRHWFIPGNRVSTRLGLPLCSRTQSVMIFESSHHCLVAAGHVNTWSFFSDSLPHFLGSVMSPRVIYLPLPCTRWEI